ncbi:hypothetical protein SLS60_002904 [Paraconiothyrium brasiliense]|uniref:F-box domain-containing protein n=1 Tax=Paraconiothyrium brasiliense TaxID=300254 RepID=A0ABR3RU84_9PLEO
MAMTTSDILQLATCWSYVTPVRGTPEGYFYHIRSLVERPNNWANLGRNSWEVGIPARSYAPDPDFLPTIDSGSDTHTRADIAEAENAGSPILKLPKELFMDIAEYLELTDLMSFQSTCRQIARQVDSSVKAGKSVLTNGTTGDDRNERISQQYNQYFWRLRKYRFTELAALEKTSDVLAKERLLCVWCTDFHAATEFHQDQIPLNAHERMCIGATASLYICRHKSLKFHDLLDIKAACKADRRSSSPLLCTEQTCLNARIWYSRRSATYYLNTDHRLPVAEAPLVVEGFSHIGSVLHPRQRINELENWSSPSVQRGLINLDAYLCPHLRTSDIECYDLLLANIYQDGTYAPWRVLREGDAYWPMRVPAVPTRFVECEADKECGAQFYVEAYKCRPTHRLKAYLHVMRFLMVDTVGSRRWLAMTKVSESI